MYEEKLINLGRYVGQFIIIIGYFKVTEFASLHTLHETGNGFSEGLNDAQGAYDLGQPAIHQVWGLQSDIDI